MTLGDAVDAWRQGGREHHCLAAVGSGLEDLLDVFGEAHIEHLVGFVEHHDLNVGKGKRAAGDVIHRSAGRGHHHVDALAQGLQLTPDGLAAVNRYHSRTEVATIFVDGF